MIDSRCAEIHGFLEWPKRLVESQIAHLTLHCLFVIDAIFQRPVDGNEGHGGVDDGMEEELEIGRTLL